MSGSQDWRDAIQKFEDDKESGRISYTPTGRLIVVGVQPATDPIADHIEAHTRKMAGDSWTHGHLAVRRGDVIEAEPGWRHTA